MRKWYENKMKIIGPIILEGWGDEYREHTCFFHALTFAGSRGSCLNRVPTVREKSVKNEKNSRSGKSQGILS